MFDQVQEFFRVVVTDSEVCRVRLLLSSYLYGCCKSRTQISRRCRKSCVSRSSEYCTYWIILMKLFFCRYTPAVVAYELAGSAKGTHTHTHKKRNPSLFFFKKKCANPCGASLQDWEGQIKFARPLKFRLCVFDKVLIAKIWASHRSQQSKKEKKKKNTPPKSCWRWTTSG